MPAGDLLGAWDCQADGEGWPRWRGTLVTGYSVDSSTI